MLTRAAPPRLGVSKSVAKPFSRPGSPRRPSRAKTDEEIGGLLGQLRALLDALRVQLSDDEDVELLPLVLGAVQEGRRGRFLEIGGATHYGLADVHARNIAAGRLPGRGTP